MNKACDFVKFLNQEDIDVFLDDTPVDKTAVRKEDKPKQVLIKKAPEVKKQIDLTSIKTLEELKQAIDSSEHPLKQTALNMVFSRGNPIKPKVMFIGEAPGQDEDIKGLPFVGKAGQLLDKMISAIKLTDEDFYLTNVINYRPENNRAPHEDEISAFLPFLKKHIELAQPQTICILGAVALKALFPDNEGITKSRGKWLDFEEIPTISTFHPAYLIRFPSKKKDAWEDLQELQKKIT